MSTEQKKVLICSYTIDECFKIPIGLDLENKDQVKEWWVKYNRLYVELTNGTELEIESQGWIHNYDYKYPSNFDEETSIHNAEEYGYEDDEWKYFDCQTGESPYLINPDDVIDEE